MESDKDAIAPGTVAIAGLVGLCNELADAGVLGRRAIARISEFMVASTEASEASPKMQADLHEAFAHHFSTLHSRLPPDS